MIAEMMLKQSKVWSGHVCRSQQRTGLVKVFVDVFWLNLEHGLTRN